MKSKELKNKGNSHLEFKNIKMTASDALKR